MFGQVNSDLQDIQHSPGRKKILRYQQNQQLIQNQKTLRKYHQEISVPSAFLTQKQLKLVQLPELSGIHLIANRDRNRLGNKNKTQKRYQRQQKFKEALQADEQQNLAKKQEVELEYLRNMQKRNKEINQMNKFVSINDNLRQIKAEPQVENIKKRKSDFYIPHHSNNSSTKNLFKQNHSQGHSQSQQSLKSSQLYQKMSKISNNNTRLNQSQTQSVNWILPQISLGKPVFGIRSTSNSESYQSIYQSGHEQIFQNYSFHTPIQNRKFMFHSFQQKANQSNSAMKIPSQKQEVDMTGGDSVRQFSYFPINSSRKEGGGIGGFESPRNQQVANDQNNNSIEKSNQQNGNTTNLQKTTNGSVLNQGKHQEECKPQQLVGIVASKKQIKSGMEYYYNVKQIQTTDNNSFEAGTQQLHPIYKSTDDKSYNNNNNTNQSSMSQQMQLYYEGNQSEFLQNQYNLYDQNNIQKVKIAFDPMKHINNVEYQKQNMLKLSQLLKREPENHVTTDAKNNLQKTQMIKRSDRIHNVGVYHHKN